MLDLHFHVTIIKAPIPKTTKSRTVEEILALTDMMSEYKYLKFRNQYWTRG